MSESAQMNELKAELQQLRSLLHAKLSSEQQALQARVAQVSASVAHATAGDAPAAAEHEAPTAADATHDAEQQ